MRTVQSFFTANLVPKAAEGSTVVDAGTRNSYQGVTRCISRLEIRFGSLTCEDNLYYHDTVALHYSQLPNTRKEILKKLEGFGNTSWFTGGGRKFAHPILSSLFVTDQALPLPLVRNGIHMSLWLAPASELFTSENVAYYEIQQPKFNFLSLTPSPDYVIALRSAVAQGRSAYIHMQRLHFFPSAGNGSNTQLIQVGINNVSSVASIEMVMWSDADYADRSKDKYLRFKPFGLIDFKIENNGASQPSQLTFQYGGDGSNPEVPLLGLMSSSGNIYNLGNDISLEPDYEQKSFRFGMNFQSSTELAGTGYSTLGSSSPFMTITTTHNAPVPPTTRILTIAVTDQLIELRGSEVSVTEIF
ncbi:hypothetical protein HDV00_008975 [Rhizophlyctis rosea]|nr:hypothetical protein HDV00_008975 [Rhizophlyctis rosea]